MSEREINASIALIVQVENLGILGAIKMGPGPFNALLLAVKFSNFILELYRMVSNVS